MNDKQAPLILIIDDDKTVRSLLKLAVKNKGYRVEEAVNGEEGVAKYQLCHPDLVLLDAIMPVMDGFNCCREIRCHSQTTPILMLTFLDDQDSIDKAFEVGATDYINKPIHWAVLFQRISRLLNSATESHNYHQVFTELNRLKASQQLLSKILLFAQKKITFISKLPEIFKEIRLLFDGDLLIFYQPNLNLNIDYDHSSDLDFDLSEDMIPDLYSYTENYFTVNNNYDVFTKKDLDKETDKQDNINLSESILNNFKSFIFVPLKKDGKVMAMMFLSHKFDYNWSEDNINLLLDISRLFSLLFFK